MKKNGFITMSLVYAFFLLFVALMVSILVNMAHNRKMKENINKEVINFLENSKPIEFIYSNNYQEWKVPTTGWYKIELWGAQGAASVSKGGYTSGLIELEQGEKYYIYVGEGNKLIVNSKAFNSGTGNSGGYPGGGATDIRYFGSRTPSSSDLEWDSLLGRKSRIMIAAGSGSGAGNNDLTKGASGGLVGNLGGGTAGGTQTTFGEVQSSSYTVSDFGIANGGCAGGNGYYPGGGATCSSGAGGGSSFISGYAGVDAINSDGTHSDSTLHYSEKYFINGEMQSGVNAGNGKARITYLGTAEPTKINTKLNNVKYIKDCINGSSKNGGNHWIELQGVDVLGINRAQGKIGKLYNADGIEVTTSAGADREFENATDGMIDSSYFAGSVATGYQCFVVDISDENNNTYDLNEVAVWHYYLDGRTYYSNTTYVSSDGTDWIPIIATETAETSQGKRVTTFDTNAQVIPIYKVTNLVANGSFTSATVTGWSVSSVNASDSVSGTISSQGLYIDDTTTTESSWNYYPYAFINGHIYYEALENKLISASAGSLANGVRNEAGVISYRASPIDILNSYEISSFRFTSSTEVKLQIGTSIATIATFYIKNVRMFDLTEIFGAGREPSKEWCDENLDYFEGTRSLFLNYGF